MSTITVANTQYKVCFIHYLPVSSGRHLADASEYCKTCDTCLRTKVNFTHRHVPMHPLPVPLGIGLRFAMDHKMLTRRTDAGNTAVMVMVESFSGFVHLIPVKDTTADTTANTTI